MVVREKRSHLNLIELQWIPIWWEHSASLRLKTLPWMIQPACRAGILILGWGLFFSSALPFVAMEMVLLGCVSGCSRPLWFTRARLRDWDEFQTRKVDLYRWNFFSVKYLGRFSWPVKIMPKTELSSLYIYFFHWIRHKRADHKWSQRYSFKWSAKNVFWPQELIDDRLKRIKGIQFPIHLEQPFPLRCRCSFCRKTSGHHQK